MMNADLTIQPATTPVVTDFTALFTPSSEAAREIFAEGAALAGRGKRQGGIKDLASGRQDIFRINPYLLRTKSGWNRRDMRDPGNIAHIDWLARSIAAEGVKEALVVYWEDGAPYIEEGHCRLLGVFRAIEVYGASETCRTVPVRNEDRKATPADRLAAQIILNTKRPYSPMEQGAVFADMLDLGMKEVEIAAKVGVHPSLVGRYLRLHRAPEQVKEMVATGAVTATLAWEALKAHGEIGAVGALSEAKQTATEKGRDRATAKDMKGGPRASSQKQEVRAIFTEAKVTERGSEVTVKLSAEHYARLREMFGF